MRGKRFIAVCLLMSALGCGGAIGGRGSRETLVLGSYSTPREAYAKAILPAFRNRWKEKTGREIDFQESYQASGAQSRAIVSGFEADVAVLSLEGDLDRIRQAGLIERDWRDRPHRGVVSTSVVVLAVRPGNPLGIRDWSDLTRPGMRLLTPDPRTSGGAQWNIAAIYGAALRAGADAAGAREFLRRVLANVSIMEKGARESITTFERGVGDVAITYENEVLVGRQAGRRYDYVIPHSTILIENPAALVDKYVDKHGVRPVAESFLDFLWTREAQAIFARYGLRPVNAEVAREVREQYPAVEDLWTIDFLGGWRRVATELFGPAGAYTKSFEELHKTP